MEEDCSIISPKERIAIKRRLKYRTNEEYRMKVKMKSSASKKRPEYMHNQREYNRLYYQKRKEELKKKRLSQKDSSFETRLEEADQTKDHNEQLEFVFTETNDDEEEEQQQVYYTVKVEEVADGSYIVQEEPIEVVVPDEGEQENRLNIDCYSFPKMPKQRGRRPPKTKSIAIQVDLEEPRVNLRKERKEKQITYQVDIGVQCSSKDFLI